MPGMDLPLCVDVEMSSQVTETAAEEVLAEIGLGFRRGQGGIFVSDGPCLGPP